MAKTILRGRFDCKIDPKGRLSFPSAFRERATSKGKKLSTARNFVLTNSQYQNRRCLDLYYQSEWLALESRIAKLPQLKAEVQAFQRFYLSAGQTLSLDSQNRILVPQGLRKYAALEEEVVLVGMGHKIEVWAADAWQEMQESLANHFEEIQGSVAQLEEELYG